MKDAKLNKRNCYHRNNCRLCGSKNLLKFLDFGEMALAGAFLNKGEIDKENKFPLGVFFCRSCFLVQILDVVSPQILFKDYRYLSSVTQTLSTHFRELAQQLAKEGSLNRNSLVVEIGSNDGVFLLPLKELGIKVLGVEPADNVAKIAQKKGVETIVDFFTAKVAKEIVAEKGKADIIVAANVFAHVDDLDEIMSGIKYLLKPNGAFIFEVHYLVDLLKKLQYDMIYHEHLCYYSVTPLDLFFNRLGFEIFKIERIPIHGGSIRVFVQFKNGPRKTSISVIEMLREEERFGTTKLGTYKKFGNLVGEHRKAMLKLLNKFKKEGKKVIGYGASGRANTILNYCGVTTNLIGYMVDESPERYGRFTPGTHIPIYPPDKFRKNYPDMALLFAWAYQAEIIKKENGFLKNGGKFILTLPKIKIL